MNILIGCIILLGIIGVLFMLFCALLIGAEEDKRIEKELKKKRSKHGNRK